MSSIGPDNRLNAAGLDRLDRQVVLDDLRRQPGTGAQTVSESSPAFSPESQASTADAGEDVLNAGAWDDIAAGGRMLDGDLGFEGQLGALELTQAADSAVDAVLGAFA